MRDITLYLILLVAVLLRLYHLGTPSLWFDESVSISTGEFLNFNNMIKNMWEMRFACPLYSTFIYYWKYFGNGEAVLRLSSVIFGIGCVVGIYHLEKAFFDRKTGLICAFLLAISPFHIYYSQELRMYALISFLTILCTYYLFKALGENKNVYWALYIIFNTLNLYIHYMTSLILLALIVFFLGNFQQYKLSLRKWLISNIVIFLSLIPWLLIFIARSKRIIEMKDYFWIPSWLPSVSLMNVFFTFKNFSIGYNATQTTYLLACGIFFFLFFWGIVKTESKKELILELCCLFIPILFMFLFSKWRVWYIDRYVIPSSIFFYLIIAKGLSVLKKKYLILSLIVIAILSSFALRNYYNNILPGTWAEHIGIPGPKEQHREAADYIAENFQKGDIILYTYRIMMVPLKWYFSLKDSKLGLDKQNNIVLNFPGESCKHIPCDYKSDEHFIHDDSKEVSLLGNERVWLIFSDFDFDFEGVVRFPIFEKLAELFHAVTLGGLRGTLSKNDKENISQRPRLEAAKYQKAPAIEVINWMDKHYIRKNIKQFNGIDIYLYIKIG